MSANEPPVPVEIVRGDATGVALPAHLAALRTAGSAFLTEAFHRFGSLAADNNVRLITRLEPFVGGNSGQKVLLSVQYARPDPGLHSDFFVKFSRDFADSFRDRRRFELEAEVRLASLSRQPGFPVKVPAAYFADFHHESGTGILITEQIAFGRGGIDELRPKCMDHELSDPVAHYRATFTALARLAAAHKAGRLSPHVERLFPFDPHRAASDLPIPWNERDLRGRVAAYAAFAQRCPRLVPHNVATPQFIERLEHDAVRLLRHESAIKRFLHASPDHIALCHWNTHLDNAWFWRNGTGQLQCGLLDWGMVRQMNVAYGLWGGLSGASLQVWNAHLDELLEVFTRELAARGGPLLNIPELKLHLDLSVAMLGLALLMDAPAVVLSRLPEAALADGPLDPLLQRNEVARGFLHVFTVFLNLWETHDFVAALDRVLRTVAVRKR